MATKTTSKEPKFSDARGTLTQWRRVDLRIVGASPLLMHSPRGLDPFDPISRRRKEITDKKKDKTDDERRELFKLDFVQGLYWDGTRIFMPAMNFKSAIAEAAGVFHKGFKIKVKRGVMTVVSKAELKFDGPHDPEQLWLDAGRRHICRVVNQGQTAVERCRPVFEQWGCDLAFLVADAEMTVEQFVGFAQRAGEFIGVGDFRPNKGGEFGRFTVEVK